MRTPPPTHTSERWRCIDAKLGSGPAHEEQLGAGMTADVPASERTRV